MMAAKHVPVYFFCIIFHLFIYFQFVFVALKMLKRYGSTLLDSANKHVLNFVSSLLIGRTPDTCADRYQQKQHLQRHRVLQPGTEDASVSAEFAARNLI